MKDAKALIKTFADGRPTATLDSWTSSQEIAHSFATSADAGSGVTEANTGVAIRFAVKTNKRGAPVAGASAHLTEDEVLMPKGVAYKVLKVRQKEIDGQTVLDVLLDQS